MSRIGPALKHSEFSFPLLRQQQANDANKIMYFKEAFSEYFLRRRRSEDIS